MADDLVERLNHAIANNVNAYMDRRSLLREAAAEIARLRAEVAAMEKSKDGAYEERNRVVAALARMLPSGIKRTAISGWSDDWHGCVYIDTSAGQVSWHFHDSQAYLFDGLPPYAGEWDGHDTPEKYERVARLRARPTWREGVEAAAAWMRAQKIVVRAGYGDASAPIPLDMFADGVLALKEPEQ